MADYLLHLVGRKLTSGFCADDSAGSIQLMQKKLLLSKQKIIIPKMHGLQIEQDQLKN